MKTLTDFYSVLEKVQYKDWTIHIGAVKDTNNFYLQVRFNAFMLGPIGSYVMQYGRKWLLSPWMTDTEVVVTAFKACLTAEEHECKERFRYNKQPVFSPHLDVDDLADALLCAEVELDERVDARTERPKGRE